MTARRFNLPPTRPVRAPQHAGPNGRAVGFFPLFIPQAAMSPSVIDEPETSSQPAAGDGGPFTLPPVAPRAVATRPVPVEAPSATDSWLDDDAPAALTPTAAARIAAEGNDAHAGHPGCTTPIFTDYAHVTSARTFGRWTPERGAGGGADYPALVALVRRAIAAGGTPQLADFITHADDYAAHFNVESGLSNGGAPTDEGVRRIRGTGAVRTRSYGIAQLHSPGLYGMWAARGLLGSLASTVPRPPSGVHDRATSATANWSVVATPAGLNYAAIWLATFYRALSRHFDFSQPNWTDFPLTGTGRSIASLNARLCSDVPPHVRLMRAFASQGSLSGMQAHLSGRSIREVQPLLSRPPTTAEVRADPQLMALRDPAGRHRPVTKLRDPWFWRSQGNLLRSWRARASR